MTLGVIVLICVQNSSIQSYSGFLDYLVSSSWLLRQCQVQVPSPEVGFKLFPDIGWLLK